MKQKNIVLIVCDQLCAGIMESYGGPVETPNLRWLADKGITFEAAYCQTPLCSPSRASMITGKYPHRHGIVDNVFRLDYPAVGGPPTEEGIDNRDETTEMLLWKHGYHTIHAGKWHLSGEDLACYPTMYREHQEYAVEMRERFEAIEQSGGPYMDWYGWKLPVEVSPAFARAADRIANRWKLVPRLHDFYAKIGRVRMEPEELYDHKLTTRCVEAIASAEEPFLLTCSFNMPHDPNVIPSPYYEAVDAAGLDVDVNAPCEPRYLPELSKDIAAQAGEDFLREFLRVYHASIIMVDEQVGRILDALQERKLEEDTVVIFTADHGDMAGGHGMFWKSTTAFYEEVARVPMIIAAPGYIRGARCNTPVELVDLPPTILELAGVPAPDMDGISLVPALSGEVPTKKAALSERLRGDDDHCRRTHSGDGEYDFMLRWEQWKYVLHCGKGKATRMLFDLAADPKEYRNLATQPEFGSTLEHMHGLLTERLGETGYTLKESWRGDGI